MPRLWFGICLLVVFVLFFFVPFVFKKADKVLRRFDSPDRALAFFALFFGLLVLLQQTTGYPYGVVYQFSDTGARVEVARLPMVSIYQRLGILVSAIYWILVAGFLFAIASLLRGTWRDLKRNDSGVEMTNELHQLNNNISKLISEIKLDRE
jgi:hypothetical protein